MSKSVDKLVDFSQARWEEPEPTTPNVFPIENVFLIIEFTKAAEEFKSQFLKRLDEKIVTVALEVAELRKDQVVGLAEIQHILRHAFERALRQDE